MNVWSFCNLAFLNKIFIPLNKVIAIFEACIVVCDSVFVHRFASELAYFRREKCVCACLWILQKEKRTFINWLGRDFELERM